MTLIRHFQELFSKPVTVRGWYEQYDYFRKDLPNKNVRDGHIRRGICGYCWMFSTKKGVLEFERLELLSDTRTGNHRTTAFGNLIALSMLQNVLSHVLEHPELPPNLTHPTQPNS